jgi:Flp pilus assembly pilin Flp
MIERLLNYIWAAVRDQRGQVFVEYALLLGVISIGLLLAFEPLGASLDGVLESITDVLPGVP